MGAAGGHIVTGRLRALAVVAAVLAVSLACAAVAMGVNDPTEDAVEGIIWGSAVFTIAIIGCVIAYQRPRNRVGWLLVVAGLGELLAGAANLYGQVGTRLPGQALIGEVG